MHTAALACDWAEACCRAEACMEGLTMCEKHAVNVWGRLCDGAAAEWPWQLMQWGSED